MRAQYSAQLDKLEAKESYFLDLAAEEGWPKDKLRAKIDGIRTERKRIMDTLEQADTELGRGRQVLYDALALLDQPQALYAAAERAEDVRRVLNAAFFHRLYVDGDKITGGELREPFDALHEAYVIFRDSKREGRTYRRTVGSPQIASSAAHPKVNGTAGSTLVGSLRRTSVRGWSKTAMVGLTLQNTNTLTAEGPEIRIKPVGTRRVFSGGGAR